MLILLTISPEASFGDALNDCLMISSIERMNKRVIISALVTDGLRDFIHS